MVTGNGYIPLIRSAARTYSGDIRDRAVKQALEVGPPFFGDIPEAAGSADGREITCAIDEPRQEGRTGRDRDGPYHLVDATPGATSIAGDLYHDPKQGT